MKIATYDGRTAKPLPAPLAQILDAEPLSEEEMQREIDNADVRPHALGKVVRSSKYPVGSIIVFRVTGDAYALLRLYGAVRSIRKREALYARGCKVI